MKPTNAPVVVRVSCSCGYSTDLAIPVLMEGQGGYWPSLRVAPGKPDLTALAHHATEKPEVEHRVSVRA